jgi:hypothetical protein
MAHGYQIDPQPRSDQGTVPDLPVLAGRVRTSTVHAYP